MSMNTQKWIALGASVIMAATLSACGSNSSSDSSKTETDETIGGDVIAPVTMEANELQGATVELLVDQVLNINTGSLAVDSYTGKVEDPSVAEFTAGRVDGQTTFNPGVTGLKMGTTKVTMTNAQGGIQPLEFTVVVK